MTQAQLDDLFRRSPAGEIPSGEATGTVIVDPGTELSEIAAKVAHAMIWQGKVFEPAHRELRNEVTPFGIEAIAAQVRARVGSMTTRASFSTTPRPRSWPTGFVTRFGNWRQAPIWGSCTGAGTGCSILPGLFRHDTAR